MARRRRRSLPEKLDRLFETVKPPNGYGRQYTYQEVAQLAVANGGPSISASYLHGLRNDPAKNPTRQALQSLSAAFGVSVMYFFDDEIADRLDADLELLVAVRDPDVREMALRAAGLSPTSLGAIAAMIDQAREWEGLGEWDGPAGDPVTWPDHPGPPPG